VQSAGVITFPVKLCESTVPEAVYLNATQAETPGSAPAPYGEECLGSANEPVAAPGILCAYRGNNGGSKENQDKNAGFFRFANTTGEYNNPGEDGALLLFRTGCTGAGAGTPAKCVAAEFSEVTIVKEIEKGAYLSAYGGWAYTEKETKP